MSVTNTSDLTVASLAAGFTLGFGFLTVWKAYLQTKTIRNPRRSAYVIMVWGEILANTVLAVLGYLFINGVLPNSVPVLFIILSLWVLELHFLMQIIINRIAIVLDDRKMISKLKFGTFLVVFMINISVFCIWLPANLTPPPFPILVQINKYWDRIEKVIVFSIDGGLNYYFLKVVQKKLLNYHGLMKYKPLVSFNARIMVLSIALDVMLIALMQLKNPKVYIQFHPLVYMAKLNIELSMGSLIKKLALSSVGNNRDEFKPNADSSSNTRSQTQPTFADVQPKHGISSSATGGKDNVGSRFDSGGIMTVKEVDIKVQRVEESGSAKSIGGSSDQMGFYDRKQEWKALGDDDEIPLADIGNHPKAW